VCPDPIGSAGGIFSFGHVLEPGSAVYRER
jgi:hypothetical protein